LVRSTSNVLHNNAIENLLKSAEFFQSAQKVKKTDRFLQHGVVEVDKSIALFCGRRRRRTAAACRGRSQFSAANRTAITSDWNDDVRTAR